MGNWIKGNRPVGKCLMSTWHRQGISAIASTRWVGHKKKIGDLEFMREVRLGSLGISPICSL